jgi:hypothetical protein
MDRQDHTGKRVESCQVGVIKTRVLDPDSSIPDPDSFIPDPDSLIPDPDPAF